MDPKRELRILLTSGNARGHGREGERDEWISGKHWLEGTEWGFWYCIIVDHHGPVWRKEKKCDMGPYRHIEGIYIGPWNQSWLEPQYCTVPVSGSHKGKDESYKISDNRALDVDC